MQFAALAVLTLPLVIALPAVAQTASGASSTGVGVGSAAIVAVDTAAIRKANPLSLTVGDWISLREPLAGGRVVRGTVSRVDPDAITYVAENDYHVYFRPYALIDTIDVRRRMPEASARTWALWGAFLGAAAGLISGPFYAVNGTMDTGPAAALFGAAGGLGGAGVGAALGAFLSPARWYRHVLRGSAGP